MLKSFLPVMKQITFIKDKRDASLLFSKSKVNLVYGFHPKKRKRQTDRPNRLHKN